MSAQAKQALAKFDYCRQNYRLYYDDNTKEITMRQLYRQAKGSMISGDGFCALYDSTDPWRIAFIAVY